MPRTASATKRARQGKVRHARLQPYKTQMKTMIRKLHDAVSEGKKDQVLALLPAVQKSIDFAAKKGIIHRNTADRKKASAAGLASKM